MRLMTAVASEKAHGCFYSLLISKWENKYNSINCINEEFNTHQLLFSKFTSCRQSCQAPFFSTIIKKYSVHAYNRLLFSQFVSCRHANKYE